MDKFSLYINLLKQYNSETNDNKKKELARDLEALKSGLIPLKYRK